MSAIATMRYADPDSARRYPLPVAGPAGWSQHDGTWQVTLALPDLLPGTILVPSLASRNDSTPARHRWALEAGGAAWHLQEVPCLPPGGAAGSASPAAGTPNGDPGLVSTHIDCYHVHRRVESARLRLTLDAPRVPDRYLISASSRALTLAVPPLPNRSAQLPEAPPPRSQMTAPPDIAGRICSPTCVSMVLNLWERPHDWLALVAECHDAATGMYGVWPLATAAAARHGCIGAIEVFDDWSEPLQVLARGVPLVTSIRFGEGELPGAPLAETSGHLVVVHGAGPGGVDVCDPAADAGSVLRRYDAAAFSRAWFRHRGAAYILPE
jgi:hypothetical protein